MNQAQELQGGCVCEAARYRVTGKPLSVHACHCTDCQKLSGSAFGLSMVLNATDIELTSGALETNIFSVGKTLMHRHHCPARGVPVFEEQPLFSELLELAQAAYGSST